MAGFSFLDQPYHPTDYKHRQNDDHTGPVSAGVGFQTDIGDERDNSQYKQYYTEGIDKRPFYTLKKRMGL